MIDYKELCDTYNSLPDQSNERMAKMDDTARFVAQRYNAMAWAKQEIRQVWQGTQDLYYCNDWEWIAKGDDFEAPIRFPTLRDVIKHLSDTFMKDPPEVILKAEIKAQEALAVGKKAYLDKIRNSPHEKKIRRQVIEDMFFAGKGFREIGYYKILKNKNVAIDGCAFDGIASRRIDYRNMFLDETCLTVHDQINEGSARDAIIRNVIPYSRFKEKFGNDPDFKIGDVRPENWFNMQGLDYFVANSRETIERTPVQAVKLYEYQNPSLDLYTLTANDKTIFEGKLSEVKGTDRLSFVDYSFEPRNDSVWGNTLPQLIAPHIYTKDVVFNLELLNLKLSLQPVIATSGEFGYNPRVHLIQPGGVWTAGGKMNGKVADNIQPLIFGNPNTKSAEMLQTINSEMQITTRSDLRSLEYYNNKSATEVLQQHQTMNAQNEMMESVNEVEAETILWDIAANEIMPKFMSEDLEDGSKRMIEAKGYMVAKKETGQPDFIKKSGYDDSFELTQDMIDYKAKIEVEDSRSKIAQKVEQMGRIMQAIPLIANLAQLSPDSLARVDIVGIMEQLIESVGLDMGRSIKDSPDEFADEFELVKEELLLGHKVEVDQTEERKKLFVRMKFAVQLKAKVEKDSKVDKKIIANQCYVIDQYMNDLLDAIGQDHLAMAKQKQAETQQPQSTQPPAPPGVTNVPQPNPSLMNAGGNPAMAQGNLQTQ